MRLIHYSDPMGEEMKVEVESGRDCDHWRGPWLVVLVQGFSDAAGRARLTPGEARAVARALTEEADRVEGRPTV